MLAANDVAAARVAADELVKIAMRRSAPFLRALSSRASGAVLLAEGNARSALVELRQSWSIWCELQAPYEASRVRLLIARAAGTWETKTTPSWSSMRPDRRFNSWALRSSFRVQKVSCPKKQTQPRAHLQAGNCRYLDWSIDIPDQPPAGQTLIAVQAPPADSGVRGVAIETADFRHPPIDYEERDRKSRRLGVAGEDLAFAYERAELIDAGREDLAGRVVMVCRTMGDTAGYDIRSFDKNTGEEIHIEVKTTSGPLKTPFFMSGAEVEYAKVCPHRYKIYRIYSYSVEAQEIKVVVIETPTQTLDFTPAIFRVRQK